MPLLIVKMWRKLKVRPRIVVKQEPKQVNTEKAALSVIRGRQRFASLTPQLETASQELHRGR